MRMAHLAMERTSTIHYKWLWSFCDGASKLSSDRNPWACHLQLADLNQHCIVHHETWLYGNGSSRCTYPLMSLSSRLKDHDHAPLFIPWPQYLFSSLEVQDNYSQFLYCNIPFTLWSFYCQASLQVQDFIDSSDHELMHKLSGETSYDK